MNFHAELKVETFKNPWDDQNNVIRAFDKVFSRYAQSGNPSLKEIFNLKELRSQIEAGNIRFSYNEGRAEEHLVNQLACFEIISTPQAHYLLDDSLSRIMIRSTLAKLVTK